MNNFEFLVDTKAAPLFPNHKSRILLKTAMNYKKAIGMVVFCLMSVVVLASRAYASTPTLSVISTGANSVALSVQGDPNSSIIFYYNTTTATQFGIRSTLLGTTNSSGYFSTTVDAGIYGIAPGGLVYVIVNSQQSSMLFWPTAQSLTPQLNQASVTVGIGQSATVTSSGNSNSVYVSTIANPGIASFIVNGNQITVTGVSNGSTSALVCYQNSGSNCASLYVTVLQNANTQLSLSQSNIFLSPGQTMTVAVYGGSGSYYISGNSNPSAVSSSLSGSTITLTAANTARGISTITVCSFTVASCGTLTATINGTTGLSNFANPSGTGIFLTPSSLSLYPGQSATVSLSGSGGYYLLGNQPAGISITINGSVATVIATSYISSGVNIATVCQSDGQCTNLTITTSGSYFYGNYPAGAGGQIYFYPTNPTIAVGQTTSIQLSGGSGTYYVPSYAMINVQASVNGSNLIITGISPGSSPISVCASISGGCSTLYVSVSGAANVITTGGLGYYQTTPTNPSIDSLLSQLQELQRHIAQSKANASATDSQNAAVQFYNFLFPGVYGIEVTTLQERLAEEGIYNGPITGYYGSLTSTAVRRYQSAHGISATGTVGPATRAALNAGL